MSASFANPFWSAVVLPAIPLRASEKPTIQVNLGVFQGQDCLAIQIDLGQKRWIRRFHYSFVSRRVEMRDFYSGDCSVYSPSRALFVHKKVALLFSATYERIWEETVAWLEMSTAATERDLQVAISRKYEL